MLSCPTLGDDNFDHFIKVVTNCGYTFNILFLGTFQEEHFEWLLLALTFPQIIKEKKMRALRSQGLDRSPQFVCLLSRVRGFRHHSISPRAVKQEGDVLAWCPGTLF